MIASGIVMACISVKALKKTEKSSTWCETEARCVFEDYVGVQIY